MEGPHSNPFNFSYIATNQSLTNGTQVNITHNMGVAWKYAYAIHAYPGAGLLLQLTEAATMPSGLDKTKVASLVPSIYTVGGGGTLSASSGTYDIIIVGQ